MEINAQLRIQRMYDEAARNGTKQRAEPAAEQPKKVRKPRKQRVSVTPDTEEGAQASGED